jgi:hypothetical protein
MTKTKFIGIILVTLSFVVWGGIIALPFINISTDVKISIGAVLAVLGEVFFWGGSVLLGKEIVKRFFNKLFNKKQKESSDI